MSDFNQLSSRRIVRLNSTLFPVTEHEAEMYGRFQIQPLEVEAETPEQILRYAADCDALVVVSAAIPADVIIHLRNCQVISRLGTGTDKIDLGAATREGILVTNVPYFCVAEQADHTMALLLALVRKLPQMQRAFAAGEWTSSRATCSSIRRLEGHALGLVGFGRSARAVARRAAGFGLRVIATRKRVDAPCDEAQRLGVEIVDLDTLLAESDYVSLHLPLTEQTYHLFDATRLSKMKPGSYLINTSRGTIVDETALVEALRNGHLAGAGLDTFEGVNVHAAEQSAPNHPLLSLDNVVLTPHVAAYSYEAMRSVGRGGVKNLVAVLSGYWPRSENVVNRHVVPRFPLSAYNEALLATFCD